MGFLVLVLGEAIIILVSASKIGEFAAARMLTNQLLRFCSIFLFLFGRKLQFNQSRKRHKQNTASKLFSFSGAL